MFRQVSSSSFSRATVVEMVHGHVHGVTSRKWRSVVHHHWLRGGITKISLWLRIGRMGIVLLMRVLLYWRGTLVRGSIRDYRAPRISVILLGLLVPYIVVD